MRSLLIAAAALSLVAQVASGHPTDPAQSEQTGVSAYVDHSRAAQPGDYFADASSWVDHTRAPQPGDYFADAGSYVDHSRAAQPGDYFADAS